MIVHNTNCNNKSSKSKFRRLDYCTKINEFNSIFSNVLYMFLNSPYHPFQQDQFRPIPDHSMSHPSLILNPVQLSGKEWRQTQ